MPAATATRSIITTNGSNTTGMEDDKERDATSTSSLYEDDMGGGVEPVSWYGGNRDISYFQPSSPQSRFDELTANHHSMSLAAVVAAASAAHESMASAMETAENASPLYTGGREDEGIHDAPKK